MSDKILGPNGVGIRECSRVVGVADGLEGRQATVVSISGDRATLAMLPFGNALAPVSALALDLTHETSRVHGAWWAFEQQPTLETAADLWTSRSNEHTRDMAWYYLGTSQEHLTRMRQVQIDLVNDHGLNPQDPALLPDGSPVVDAHALRLVMEQFSDPSRRETLS